MSKSFRSLAVAAALSGAALCSLPAVAAPVVVDFGTGGAVVDYSTGAWVSFAGGAVKAQALRLNAAGTAWVTNSPNAYLRETSSALGVGGSNQNFINALPAEAVLFDFGADNFRHVEVFLGSYSTSLDRLNVWIGDTLNLGSPSLPLLPAAQIFAGASPNSPFTVNLSYARYMMIGAAPSATQSGTGCGSANSCFTIDQLRMIPEPGTLALAGLAIAAAGFIGRRRRD